MNDEMTHAMHIPHTAAHSLEQKLKAGSVINPLFLHFVLCYSDDAET